ncbi:MAG: hypothetical protein K2N13_01015 [Paraprevotella sp.]|nr:hypothetical protein [Paraprevotella sp.]
MDKVYGTSVRQDGLHKVGRRHYTLFYGLYTDERGGSYEYRHTFDHKPTWEEVEAVLLDAINEHTRETILNGFEWSGQRIWLSDENQRNFMMMEKLTEEAYPLKVKINEDSGGQPIYHIFVSELEFAAFSKLSSQHVTETLQAGWQEKDNLNPATFGFDVL